MLVPAGGQRHHAAARPAPRCTAAGMTMQRFSALSLLGRALGGHRGWTPQWRRASPQPAYDAIIIGGGGHGLGAAYYLAREHRLGKVAVLEKGWIGGGNTGRNTTIIRSNYLFPESAALYDHALRMWESLAQALNYNVMFSPRGVLMLAHTVHDAQVFQRHIHANRAAGVDNEWLTPLEAQRFCPLLKIGDIRYPVLGAALQRRGGTARHDAVAWGYARAADALGVDIIENCEVTGIRLDGAGAVEGVETTRGPIRAARIGVVRVVHVDGHEEGLRGRSGHGCGGEPGRVRSADRTEIPARDAAGGRRAGRARAGSDTDPRRRHQPHSRIDRALGGTAVAVASHLRYRCAAERGSAGAGCDGRTSARRGAELQRLAGS